jgi:hypothetical protein
MLSIEQFKEKKDYPPYQPTEDEATMISFVKRRFSAMQSSRAVIDKDWDIYQTMIDAVLVPYGDERSSSNVPLASAIIELFVAEASKIKTEWIFKGETSSYSAQAKALEYVWKYDWRKNNRKKEFIKNEYITAGFGRSVLYTGFESYTKTQKDMVVNEDGNISREDKDIKVENIIVDNVDIRDFYLDDQAVKGMDDAVDCYYRQRMSYEKFKNYETNDLYKNIDKVVPRGYSNEWRTFNVDQDQWKSQWNFVLREFYWNTEKDCFIEIANGVLVREHPMTSTIDGMKALPFVIRVLWQKNYNYTGRGICEYLVQFLSDLNNLRELRMDAIRRSNTSKLAIGEGLSFKGRDFSYDNEIITFDGKLDNSTFQQISGTWPNQQLMTMTGEDIMKEIAIYVGLDIQNILWDSTQTAFQTNVQVEASQKRINVWLTNRDLAFERYANLMKDLYQTFFPRKTAEWVYPEIEMDGEELVHDQMTDESGAISEPKPRFRKKKGKRTFQVTPDLLRGDVYIDVFTNTNAPTINAVDRQQKLDFMTAIWPVLQTYAMWAQSGLDLEEFIPFKKTMKELMSDYNFEVQDQWNDDHIEAQKAKQALLQELMAKMPQAPWDVQAGQGQPQPSAPWVWQAPAQPPQPQPTAPWMMVATT